MKRLLLLVILVAGGLAGVARGDPSDEFLRAYFLVQEGDAATQQQEWVKAQGKFRDALEVLRAVASQAPQWNPHIIEFRINYCNEQLQKLEGKLPAQPLGTPPAPSVAAVALVPPAGAIDQVTEVTNQLRQARQRVEELETEREKLQDRLEEALRKVEPTDTSRTVENLLAENKKLTESLAAAQEREAALREQADELEAVQERLSKLQASREELSDRLAAALKQVAVQEQAGTENAALRETNEDLSTRLADTLKQLAQVREAVQEAADSAEVKQLRSELQTALTKLAATERDLAASQRELGEVHQQLEETRVENVKLRQTYAVVLVKLDDAHLNLRALQSAGRKDEEIIRYLRKENALLKEIAEGKTPFLTRRPRPKGPRLPELKGWRPRGWAVRRAEAEAAKTAPSPPAPEPKESATGKLVVELAAPPPVAAPPASSAPGTAVVEAVTGPVPARPEPDPQPVTMKAAERLLGEADEALAANDLDTAEARYRSALEGDPQLLAALNGLGVVGYRRGQWDVAAEHLRRSIAQAPNDSESRSLLGIVYVRQGKVDEAFTELTRAIALDPRNAEAHNFLGITLNAKGWRAAAEQQLRKALELNPNYGEAHFNLAVFYASQRTPRLALAREHYRRALELGTAPDQTLEESLKGEE
ncbi:tetratricopeptide repeat protein [bacterium]|nr:tetratricopeptide repeat protein [bacterium]